MSDERKWTAGTWAFWPGTGEVFGEYDSIAMVLLRGDEGEANCRLIVAAPEMYEALEKARKELAVFEDDAVCDHEANVCWCDYWQTRDDINAALAKADGETP